MATSLSEQIFEVRTESEPAQAEERKRAEKEAGQSLAREKGKSLLPFARVQKIIKADKELPMVAREAVFLISLATEEFVKRLSEASQRAAGKERRTTVQQRDIAGVVRRADEFAFLEEIVGWTSTDSNATKRKPKALEKDGEKAGSTMLDHFVKGKDRTDGDGDVHMNEGGTMSFAGAGDSQNSDS